MNKYPFDWDAEKNVFLRETRGICFEDLILAINNGAQVIDEPHPNQKKFPHQRVIVVMLESYAVVAPYVIDEERQVRFFKTMFPSRRATKIYFPKNYE